VKVSAADRDREIGAQPTKARSGFNWLEKEWRQSMNRESGSRPVPNERNGRLFRLADKVPRLTRLLLRFLKGRGALPVSRLAVAGLRVFPRLTMAWCLRALEWTGGTNNQVHWLLGRLEELPAKRKARLIALGISQAARVYEHYLMSRSMRAGHAPRPHLRWLVLATSYACNLRCTGCYAKPFWAHRHASFSNLAYIGAEAERMGVEAIVVTGWGEPFYDRGDKENLFRLARKHPGILFAVFTNGTLITQADLDTVERLGNLVLLLSLDGLEKTNDARRGKGVFRHVAHTAEQLKHRKMVFGMSVTVTGANYREITSPEFVRTMQDWGVLWLLYLRFTSYPAEHEAVSLIISPEEILEYYRLLKVAREQHVIPLVDADEAEIRRGGCQAQTGNLAFVDALTGRVSGCVKLPLAASSNSLFVRPGPGRLGELLQSDYFQKFWKDFPGSWHCREGSKLNEVWTTRSELITASAAPISEP
jgi:MoaA/NifB/PqqE/SkfB family radical SAM enzyme